MDQQIEVFLLDYKEKGGQNRVLTDSERKKFGDISWQLVYSHFLKLFPDGTPIVDRLSIDGEFIFWHIPGRDKPEEYGQPLTNFGYKLSKGKYIIDKA